VTQGMDPHPAPFPPVTSSPVPVRSGAEPPEPSDAALLQAHVDGDPVVAAEQRHKVTAALDRLNADQRAARMRVDVQGYSVEEAAAILGCAPGTVKSRCARGRAELAPVLAAMRPLQRKGDDPLEPPPRAQRHTGAREARRET
jgi:RNA polymerase sigma-70 factor (ECF subfamily)